MTEKTQGKLTPGSLPTNHFAILFEGAWIFTPTPDNSGVLATCPLADDGMHSFEFGIWKKSLSTFPPFENICFPMGGSFTVTIDPEQIECEEPSFTSIFDKAAAKYPFVYLPASNADGKSEDQFILRAGEAANSRTVSLPFPTLVRAVGALTSAEVGGPGVQQLFGGTVSVKRTFVTFLFLYTYEDQLDAQIDLAGTPPTCGELHADKDQHPHLIFRVRPANMKIETDDCAMQAGMPAMAAPRGDSGEKLHVISVFDQLRQNLVKKSQSKRSANDPCCDLLVYHDQGMMKFDCGDTGLGGDELGLGDQCSPLHGRTLPACAGGGIVSGGTNP